GAFRLDARLRSQPVVQRGEVPHRVQPLRAVVQMLVALAVAGRAADVRDRDGEPARGEVRVDGGPAGPRLRLRTAVDADDDRGPLRVRGDVEEARDRLAVEGLEAMQLRLRQPDELVVVGAARHPRRDRKSTRLNSSHVAISYAVFCL